MSKGVLTIKDILISEEWPEDMIELAILQGLVKVNGRRVYKNIEVAPRARIDFICRKPKIHYEPINDDELDIMEEWDLNWKQIEVCDNLAAKAGSLVGRYITEPVADGSAVYQIIRENKKTVRIKLCTGIGDDWAVPYWGIETTIDKQYAVDKIRNRERLEEFFRKRAKEEEVI